MAGQRWWRMIPLRPVAVALFVLFCVYSVARMITVSSPEFVFQQRQEVLAGVQMQSDCWSSRGAQTAPVPSPKISKPSTKISKPSTTIPKPSTKISKPSTTIPKPSTKISKPSTTIPKPSTKISKPFTKVVLPSIKLDSRTPAKLADMVVKDSEVLYVVKACRRFQARSQAIYSSWGNKVSNVIFSTDVALDQIPAKLQRTVSLADPASQAFMRSRFQAFHAASCAVTILNLGVVLAEKQFADIKWLVIVDDDTFVIKDRLAAYMSTMDHHKPFYLGFSNAEPLYFLPGCVRVSATAPGVAYSRGVLDMLRRDSTKLFTRPATFDLCRRSQMGDDVAIGLLVWFQYKVNVTARPDLRGFHWRNEKDPVGVQPITIHTEQQFKPGQISRLKQLADQYYPPKA